jgi:hypothetical protein
VALLFSVEIANVALWGTSPTLRTGATLPAGVLSCLAAIVIVVALSYGHQRSLRSPALLGIYLALSTLFDVVRSRSYFLRPGYYVFGFLSVATGALKLLLLILEEIPKTSRFVPGPQLAVGSEARSGFWNRTLFIWLNRTLLRGFRKVLTVDDLENLGLEFTSEYLLSIFLEKWNTSEFHFIFLLLSCCSSLDANIIPTSMTILQQINPGDTAWQWLVCWLYSSLA